MSAPLSKDDVLFWQRLLKCAGLYTDVLDGLWGKNTDAAMKAFEESSRRIRESHGTFDSRTEGRLQGLHPKAQEAARIFLGKVGGTGIEARIISGTRTYAEQDVLFRQGRFGNPGPRVTNARGGQSNHNFGIAWDIGIFRNGKYLPESPSYAKAAEIGLSPGLEWGGNWTSIKDFPHYQLATGLRITDVRAKFEQGQLSV